MAEAKRVLVLGLGATGLLVSLVLSKRFRVTAVTPRRFFLTSQNVGGRLAWPEAWERVSKIEPARFAKLEGVEIVQGLVLGIDLRKRTATVAEGAGVELELRYDALVIATGADNGFWRRTLVETSDEEAARREEEQARIAAARSVIIVGGGASALSMAASLGERFGDKSFHLFHSGDRILRSYPQRVARTMTERLEALGVSVHPGHRARTPGDTVDAMGAGRVEWTTGQAPAEADLVLWAVGRARPNSSFVPPELLDEERFVNVRPTLQVFGHDDVFCVGDLASTDPHRCSARNGGAGIVVTNVARVLTDPALTLRRFVPPQHKWGELTVSPESGMWLFTPGGRRVRLGPWFVRRVIFDWIVFRLIYGGVGPRQ